MSKIQNLKAIHNDPYLSVLPFFVVSDVKDTKFESNSQLEPSALGYGKVVSDVKDTKFESNSQQLRPVIEKRPGCF